MRTGRGWAGGGRRSVTPPVRRTRAGVLAAALGLGILGMSLPPAGAADAAVPRPRDEEWWFSAWEVQNRVWPVTQGHGVTVAVLDSGTNARLPDLSNAVVPGADFAGGTGDGRVDTRKNGHGTAMAALIAGQGNGVRMVGVAPEAKLLPVVVNSFPVVAAKGIRYAADRGAKVINISLINPSPGGCPVSVQEAVSYAVDRDAVVVASAGNSGDTTNFAQYPANCAGVLAVGALDNKKKVWARSQRQPYVDVAAPGVRVGSLTKEGRFNYYLSGTSQAAALTSAAVALLRAKEPDLSAREAVQRIINTAVEAGPPGRDNQTGAGAVFPPAALTKTVPKNAPNPPFERLDRWRAENGKPSAAADAGRRAAPAASSITDRAGSLLVPIVTVSGLAALAVLIVAIVIVVRRRPS